MLHNASRWLSRHRKVSVIGAVAVLVSVPLVTSAASRTESAGIPPATASQLTAIALAAATGDGDAKPEWMKAVATTRDKALTVATPGDTVPGSASNAVYTIVIAGKFILNSVSRPPNTSAPQGNFLTIVLDSTTLQLMDLGLSNNDPSAALGTLGIVSPLTKQR